MNPIWINQHPHYYLCIWDSFWVCFCLRLHWSLIAYDWAMWHKGGKQYIPCCPTQGWGKHAGQQNPFHPGGCSLDNSCCPATLWTQTKASRISKVLFQHANGCSFILEISPEHLLCQTRFPLLLRDYCQQFRLLTDRAKEVNWTLTFAVPSIATECHCCGHLVGGWGNVFHQNCFSSSFLLPPCIFRWRWLLGTLGSWWCPGMQLTQTESWITPQYSANTKWVFHSLMLYPWDTALLWHFWGPGREGEQN